jgi:hypothetical protein
MLLRLIPGDPAHWIRGFKMMEVKGGIAQSQIVSSRRHKEIPEFSDGFYQ